MPHSRVHAIDPKRQSATLIPRLGRQLTVTSFMRASIMGRTHAAIGAGRVLGDPGPEGPGLRNSNGEATGFLNPADEGDTISRY